MLFKNKRQEDIVINVEAVHIKLKEFIIVLYVKDVLMIMTTIVLEFKTV